MKYVCLHIELMTYNIAIKLYSAFCVQGFVPHDF
jgi:hypothetical protein